MDYVYLMSQITWSCKCFADTYGCFIPGIEKIVSYLPLSHIAGQASHNHLPKPNDSFGLSSKMFHDTSPLRCWTCSFRSILVVQHILPSQMHSRCIVHTTAHTCVEGILYYVITICLTQGSLAVTLKEVMLNLLKVSKCKRQEALHRADGARGTAP